MRMLLYLLVLVVAVPGWGQFGLPASASAILGFPQLADGGTAEQKWTSTFDFNNPNLNAAASVQLYFYSDAGQPLALDFGGGPVTTLNLTVPAGGMTSVRTTGASETTVTGWGIARATLPVTGTVSYQMKEDGVPVWDVAAMGTSSTYYYTAYANPNLGIAVANPGSQPVNLLITARNNQGTASGTYAPPSLPAMGHGSFNLLNVIPGLPSGFEGSITITPTDNPPRPFVAWSVNFREGLLSPLPPGEMQWPGPYNRRHVDVGILVQNASASLIRDAKVYLLGEDPEAIADFIMTMSVVIDPDTSMKAYYRGVDKTVHITQGMLEMLGANDAALGFIIAHVGLHGAFTFTDEPTKGPFANDAEGAADTMGAFALLKAGLDPGGAADFFSRLLYAYMQNPSNLNSAFRNEFSIPNGIPARLQKLWTNVRNACGASTGLTEVCEKARRYWHPQNPANIP
jgi:hypothetical protein